MKTHSNRPTAESVSAVDMLMNALAALLLITAMSKGASEKATQTKQARMQEIEQQRDEAAARLKNAEEILFRRDQPLVPAELKTVLAPYEDLSRVAICISGKLPEQRERLLKRIVRSISGAPALREVSFWIGKAPAGEVLLLDSMPRQAIAGEIERRLKVALENIKPDSALPPFDQIPADAWILLVAADEGVNASEFNIRAKAERLLLLRLGIQNKSLETDLNVARLGGTVVNVPANNL